MRVEFARRRLRMSLYETCDVRNIVFRFLFVEMLSGATGAIEVSFDLCNGHVLSADALQVWLLPNWIC